jgi:hypothetical protein
MSPEFARDLQAERRRYYVSSGGGLSLPVAGAVYWLVIGGLGYSLDAANWSWVAAAMSGLIFPLGILLQGPLRSPFLKAKSPLSGLVMQAVLAINLLWPVHVVIISLVPEASSLSLAIGMTLHWPLIGWAYGSRVCLIHAVSRIALVSAIWFLFPDMRMTVLPFAVAGLYLLAAAGMSWEVRRARRAMRPVHG